MSNQEPTNADKLDEIYRLTHENHKMLVNLRSHNRWAAFFRVMHWILLIAISVFIFYYIQPYIEALVKSYNSLANGINEVKEIGDKIPDFPDFKSLF